MIQCPSCKTRIEKSSRSCPNCAYQICDLSKGQSLSIVTAARRPKNQCDLDFATGVDRTDSSKKFREGISKSYISIVDLVTQKVCTMRCWIQTHGDRDEGQHEELITDGGTPEQAKEDIQKVVYGGGGPPEENHLDGIETLLNRVPWTADPLRSRGVILGFLTAETKVAESGTTATELGSRIKEMGILLILICQAKPILSDLVDAAGGLMFEITNKPDQRTLESIASKIGASIVASVASGTTIPLSGQQTQSI